MGICIEGAQPSRRSGENWLSGYMSMNKMLQTVKRRLSNSSEGDLAAVSQLQLASATSMGVGSSQGTARDDGIENVARSDVSLPKRERRRSSLVRNQKVAALKDLPHLKDTNMQKREALFQQKLELCSVLFNFEDAASDKKGKDLKRQTLLELVDYVNNAGGQKIFTEALMPDIMGMVVRRFSPILHAPLLIHQMFDSRPIFAARCRHKPKTSTPKKTNQCSNPPGPIY
ncbi:hypothetical protein DYB30_011880, partial [Aphanomyces astaci]